MFMKIMTDTLSILFQFVKDFVNFLIKNSGNCSINEAGFLKLSKNIPFCSINILISI